MDGLWGNSSSSMDSVPVNSQRNGFSKYWTALALAVTAFALYKFFSKSSKVSIPTRGDAEDVFVSGIGLW